MSRLECDLSLTGHAGKGWRISMSRCGRTGSQADLLCQKGLEESGGVEFELCLC